MFRVYEPEAGRWYVNRTGKLIKVKMVLWQAGQPERVLIEYLDGLRLLVDIESWRCLHLCEHVSTAGQAIQYHS